MALDKITYTNGEITVVWQPKLCIHSGNCVRGLPMVFNYRLRPWITMGGANTEEIVRQVNKCPSGALSFYFNQEQISPGVENEII
ncbi:MAG: (4Fe-4S)-binding protein [Chitinophagales bacterium]|nr:(4Fe-4S)-binding protein [Chitinophagales bacterium]